jgi:hypothetical protein
VADPKALGMVLAMIVDPAGKPVRGGSAKGQLYVTSDELVVVRPTAASEVVNRIATGLLLGSVAAVVLNLFTWKSTGVLWAALVAQALYWLALPARRKQMEPAALSAAELSGLRGAGRVAIHVPVKDIVRAVPPEPPRTGLRKPARFELAEGALEVYLSEEQFRETAATLGR